MDETTRRPDAADAPSQPTGGTIDPSDASGAEAGAPGGGQPRFSRRQVLTMAGAGGLIGAGVLASWLIDDDPATSGRATANRGNATTSGSTTTTAAPDPAPVPATALWSDPATWGGTVPGPGDVAVISQPVVLDVDAAVAGVRIEGTGELVFDAAASRTLTSTGNVVVAGALRARPQAHSVTHRVVFEGIDESRVVGDHTMEPLDTDVGLWVVGAGVLDFQGAPKRSWTHLAAPAAGGDGGISVGDAAGWQVGDEIVVTPTEPATVEGFAEHHDRRVVAAVSGTSVTLDRPLDFAHPAVTVRPGVTHQAEVLNLTRNVQVEGTPGGRAHVMLLDVAGPQSIAYVGLRHLGPQKPLPEGGDHGVVGRYSLHFHMSHDATRGSLVEGVVAYEGGNHAFVPHLSHGVTFRDCIAHDQADTAFWWDPAPDDAEPDSVPTNDLVYERCVAHLIRTTEGSTYSASGYVLGTGQGNVARGCVAVGVLGNDEATSAYKWSPDSRDEVHTWTFEDCVSHNNNGSSIYFWINGVPRTIIDRFTAYQDRHGIRAGSYTNLVSYRDCTVYGCLVAGLYVVAVAGASPASPGQTVTYENVYVDQAGLTEYAVYVTGHVVDPDQPTRVSGGHFTGGTKAQVGFPEPGEYAQLYEFTGCTYDGNAFWLADGLAEVVDIRVNDGVHGSIVLRPADRPGDVRSDWNASVSAV